MNAMDRSREVISDEVAYLESLVPLAGARVVELGCGKADFARKLVERTGVESVTALEVDRIQHRRNVEGPQLPRLTFAYGGAQDIPLADGAYDGVVMMKSLHHVPIEHLDRAMQEIRRVLKPGGWLYVSEPVYAGEFNEIVRLFHDEGLVRAEAYQALQRASKAKLLEAALEHEFMAPLAFRDYDDFVEKIVRATHSEHVYTDDVAADVRARFAKYETPQGAKFIRPMRVNLLRRPAGP
jgi:ubiquinone/menaquinone biosynthesis C-methylase UbiE